jgi:hypothetical protein
MKYSQTPRNLAAMLSRGPASFAATMLRALSPELGQTLRVYPWRPMAALWTRHAGRALRSTAGSSRMSRPTTKRRSKPQMHT